MRTQGAYLDERQQQALLAWARQAIARAVHAGDGAVGGSLPDEPVFREKRAAFLTLTRNGRLRGCIGTLLAVESLGDSVRHNALNAALRDPRFAPLAAAELPETRIEISVLDAPAPLVYRASEDLLSQLQAERPSLILEADGHRATFLPQVWAQLPEARDFLSALCRKAGLPMDAWQDSGLCYRRYAVQCFREKQ